MCIPCELVILETFIKKKNTAYVVGGCSNLFTGIIIITRIQIKGNVIT